MHVKTLLNACHRIKGFVYTLVRFEEVDGAKERRGACAPTRSFASQSARAAGAKAADTTPPARRVCSSSFRLWGLPVLSALPATPGGLPPLAGW